MRHIGTVLLALDPGASGENVRQIRMYAGNDATNYANNEQCNRGMPVTNMGVVNCIVANSLYIFFTWETTDPTETCGFGEIYVFEAVDYA